MNEPIAFNPIYHERVWGGRALESRYGRELPDPQAPYGESWELCDREEGESVVAAPRALAGRTLGELWRDERGAVFGERYAGREGRFPLLVKILDARDRLSIQVHPPEEVAPRLGGEPKTEMWYVAAAEPGAALYVGLKPGIAREDFERGIAKGQTEGQVHRIEAAAGDFIFIPSGRLHAIGAGLTIFEIQQNSDTTYRVFDWNRVGLDGKPRKLHVEASLECIRFDDVEPGMGVRAGETLVDCPEFKVEEWKIEAGQARAAIDKEFAIIAVVEGMVTCGSATFGAGGFFLVPANAEGEAGELRAIDAAAKVLRTTLP